MALLGWTWRLAPLVSRLGSDLSAAWAIVSSLKEYELAKALIRMYERYLMLERR